MLNSPSYMEFVSRSIGVSRHQSQFDILQAFLILSQLIESSRTVGCSMSKVLPFVAVGVHFAVSHGLRVKQECQIKVAILKWKRLDIDFKAGSRSKGSVKSLLCSLESVCLMRRRERARAFHPSMNTWHSPVTAFSLRGPPLSLSLSMHLKGNPIFPCQEQKEGRKRLCWEDLLDVEDEEEEENMQKRRKELETGRFNGGSWCRTRFHQDFLLLSISYLESRVAVLTIPLGKLSILGSEMPWGCGTAAAAIFGRGSNFFWGFCIFFGAGDLLLYLPGLWLLQHECNPLPGSGQGLQLGDETLGHHLDEGTELLLLHCGFWKTGSIKACTSCSDSCYWLDISQFI